MKISLTTSLLAVILKFSTASLTRKVTTNHVGREAVRLNGHHYALSPTEHDETEEESRKLITGGYEVQDGDYPYLAYILYYIGNELYYCGGTLIHRNWILTTATCLNVDDVTNITAVLGAHNITTADDEYYAGESIELHNIASDGVHVNPDYNDQTLESNFVLLHFTKPSNKTFPKLNDNFDVPADEDIVWTAGWGQTDDYYV
jgi:hypothetical protein